MPNPDPVGGSGKIYLRKGRVIQVEKGGTACVKVLWWEGTWGL